MGSTATGVFTLEFSHSEWLACPNHMGINCHAKRRVSVSWERDFQLSPVGRTGNSDLSKDGGRGGGRWGRFARQPVSPRCVQAGPREEQGWGYSNILPVPGNSFFVYSFSKYTVSTYYVPDIILGPVDSAVNKAKMPSLWRDSSRSRSWTKK